MIRSNFHRKAILDNKDLSKFLGKTIVTNDCKLKSGKFQLEIKHTILREKVKKHWKKFSLEIRS